jgi:hypothetical protein
VAEQQQGKGCGSLVFFFFLAAGLIFGGLTARQTLRSALVYTWPSATCTVLTSSGRLESDARDNQDPFAFDVSYTYQWQGHAYTSNVLSRSSPRFANWSKVRALEKRFPPGSSANCYIDPDDPSDGVLLRPSLWIALFIPFSLVFVLLGGGGVYGLFQRKRGPEPISQRARRKGKLGQPLLFAVLLFGGAALFLGFCLEPMRLLIASQSWPQSQCRVLFSRVGVHDGDDGTTYSVDVLYAWDSAGREYRSSRYRFFDFSASGGGAREAIAGLRPGSWVACYIDPGDPEEAVLHPEFTPFALISLVPVGMFVAGAICMRRVLRPPGNAPVDPIGKLVLKPSAAPLVKLAVVAVFTLFWNGIVVLSWEHSNSPGPTLFLIPFVAVGLGGIGWTGYLFLGLFTPEPVLTLSTGYLTVGSNVTFEWRIPYGAGAVRSLQIRLEGREEATYTRGTDSVTEKNVFRSLLVLDRNPFQGQPEGSAMLKIPSGVMHSFAAKHNRVVWLLKVTGRVRFWPDMDIEFPLEVRP